MPMSNCLRNILLMLAAVFIAPAAIRVIAFGARRRMADVRCPPFFLRLKTVFEGCSLTSKCVFFPLRKKIPCLVRLQAEVSDLVIVV